MAVDPVLALALRLSLALLLMLAAAHKLREPEAFAAAFANYELLPRPLATSLAPLVPMLELGASVGLVLAAIAPFAALAAGGLFALYGVAIAANLCRGRVHIDCGCSGPGGRRRIHRALVARNGVLVLVAFVAAFPTVARPLLWLDALTAVAATLAFAAMYAAADVCMENAPRLRAWRGAP